MRVSRLILIASIVASSVGVAGCGNNGDHPWLFGRSDSPAASPPASASSTQDAATFASPAAVAAEPASSATTAAEAAAKAAESASMAPSPASNPLPAASPADSRATRPFAFPREGQPDATATSTACQFPGLAITPRTSVFAAGAYAGRPLDFLIDASNHKATQIDVAVNHTQGPVVLMLGAYEPTIWNIGWSTKTKIAAVLVSGYNRQVVAGLPADVPTLISTYDNRGACGYFYVDASKLDTLDPAARRILGHAVDMVYPAKAGQVVIGDMLDANVVLVTGPTKPESYRNQATYPPAGTSSTQWGATRASAAALPVAIALPPDGDAGLAEAVAKGLMREATAADVQAWANAMATQPTGLPPVAGGRPTPRPPRLWKTYVVLKPMIVPGGLTGAHAATFIVPNGVPRPTGELGHSKILDYNTMTCAGLTCSME